MSPRYPLARPLLGCLAILTTAAAVSAAAQPGQGGLPPTPASAPGLKVVTTAPAPVPATSSAAPKLRRRRPQPGERTIRAANAGARSFPAPDAYINATLYYDYEAGRLYEVETSPHFLTAIMLRPGEKLMAKAAGDTVRWVLGETAEGSGPNTQVVVLLKPIRGGLRTNVVLTTDQRTYLIEASSRDGGAYTSAVSWNYPQEQMQALAAAQAQARAADLAAKAADAQLVVATPASPIDQLHFGYDIRPIHGKPPRWQPIRVFDDGIKTYIQFPINMAATDAPPLFLVGPGDKAELVNYRYLNGYYVVDRLVDVAELRIGEKPQTIVRITRTKDRG
jgi:P-type conjugative transfer protein TrbG